MPALTTRGRGWVAVPSGGTEVGRGVGMGGMGPGGGAPGVGPVVYLMASYVIRIVYQIILQHLLLCLMLLRMD